MKPSASKKEILSLHKYFIRADLMRKGFDGYLAAGKTPAEITDDMDAMNYLVLWYGCLYVVIEGWERLGLQDRQVQVLFDRNNIHLLKGTRHDTFHFQREYDPLRTVNFLTTENVAGWVRLLHRELSRFFLEWIEQQKVPTKN